MKKSICLFLLAIIVLITSHAQYKKASFFTRNGKFYGINTGMHLYGKGVKPAPVIGFAYGKDKGDKRIWHWWDLEVVMSGKFSYATVDQINSATKVTVSGKTNTMLNWRYNWCYYFADNTNDDIKGLPFAKIAVQIAIAGFRTDNSNATATPANTSAFMTPYYNSEAYGADLGVGYAYKINETATFYTCAGYRIFNNVDLKDRHFNLAPNSPYLNIAIRFARKNKD